MNTRTCIVCRGKDIKSNLVRLVKFNDDIYVDMIKELSGRGVYVHKTMECLDKMCKAKSLDRAFKMKVSDKRYSYLKGTISE